MKESSKSASGAERAGHVVFFWRGARRKDRRWWRSMADRPPERVASAREVAHFFVLGVSLAAAAGVAWALLTH